MDNMTQQNAALVEETAAASEEMSNQAQELLSLVQQFKIRDSFKNTTSDTKHKEIHIKGIHAKKQVQKTVNIKTDYNPLNDGYEKF
jgi:hypothetical protein